MKRTVLALGLLAVAVAATPEAAWMQFRLAIAAAVSPPPLAASESVPLTDLNREQLLARCVWLDSQLTRWQPPIPQAAARPIDDRVGSAVLSLDPPAVTGGAGHRLQVDDLVADGCRLIGRVDRIDRFSSRFVLLGDPSFRQPVVLVTDDGRLLPGPGGLLVGGERMTVERIGVDVPVRVGQWVATAAADSPVLIVGRVSSATRKVGQTDWSITVDPPPVPRVGQPVEVLRRRWPLTEPPL